MNFKLDIICQLTRIILKLIYFLYPIKFQGESMYLNVTSHDLFSIYYKTRTRESYFSSREIRSVSILITFEMIIFIAIFVLLKLFITNVYSVVVSSYSFETMYNFYAGGFDVWINLHFFTLIDCFLYFK